MTDDIPEQPVVGRLESRISELTKRKGGVSSKIENFRRGSGPVMR